MSIAHTDTLRHCENRDLERERIVLKASSQWGG